MKKAILFSLIIFIATSCTENTKAKMFGGTMTINLPHGQRLINATWKSGKNGSDLWYLTEPMDTAQKPRKLTFHEKSDMGVWEGTVIFVEQE